MSMLKSIGCFFRPVRAARIIKELEERGEGVQEGRKLLINQLREAGVPVPVELVE